MKIVGKKNVTITKSDEKMRQELRKYLIRIFERHGTSYCDGTLKLSAQFLEQNAENEAQISKIIGLLNNYGGHCDCEVVFNVYEPWKVGKEVTIDVWQCEENDYRN